MLRINRLRVEIKTLNGTYGIDVQFHDGLNFVSSSNNTSGKSSIIAAIYYCLGFEQIIGGTNGIGAKTLTSVYKSAIEDHGKIWNVTESGAYLEIKNGFETITIFRSANRQNRDDRLISVYYGTYETVSDPKTQSEDMYVNVQNSATSPKGFHSFLEGFLHFELPAVRTTDDNERKLYLQVIFSSIFIEQKHGWADLFSGMPSFGIREPKKHVIEYLLNLDTYKTNKDRDSLKNKKASIESEWRQIVAEIQRIVSRENCVVLNVPQCPVVLSDVDIKRVSIISANDNSLNDEISRLKNEYVSLKKRKSRIVDNFKALSDELSETEKTIGLLENDWGSQNKRIMCEDANITRLKKDLEIINSDIRNNNDAARLQQFGSEAIGEACCDVCPVCKQHIHDNLLLVAGNGIFMSIEENIRHLKGQKAMLEFSLSSSMQNTGLFAQNKVAIEATLMTLRRLAQTIRSDLNTSVESEDSEAIAIKRYELQRSIDALSHLNKSISEQIELLVASSKKWNAYLDAIKKLPSKGLTDEDEGKLSLLRNTFVQNLQRYDYRSNTSFSDIQISKDSFLPTIDGFDMKFDSSASDSIRVIWAFTMALLQVSIAKRGNHPKILIFDEPAQHSIVPADVNSLFNSVVELGDECQVIIGITLNSDELPNIIGKLQKNTYHKITVDEKAFTLFNSTAKNGDASLDQ
ncbi:MAG: hypothetical protein AB9917_19110 [Negativicutes bacterium]